MRRPKKPGLDSIRERKFSEQLRGLKHRPNGRISERIDSKMFSLDNNRLFHHKPEVLAAEEYKGCLELFERRLPYESSRPTGNATQLTYERLHRSIKPYMEMKELQYKEELEEIAVDCIREMFDIPDHLQLLPNIDVSLDLESEDQQAPEVSLSDEDRREMWDEVQKRVILNGLVHGCSMHIWKTAHFIVKEKIDELDPLLMTMYDEYTAGIGWLIWQLSPDSAQAAIGSGGAITQGFNQLRFDEAEESEFECNVHCHAVNFPVLLHEVAKGAMDYLICHAIPEGYTEEQLEYYYAKADAYENELWHYLMSPTLWNKLLLSAQVTTQELPGVIMNLCRLNYQDLSDVLKSCIDGKEEGSVKLKAFKIV